MQKHDLTSYEQHEREMMRAFDTGATRNVDDENYGVEGFFSPLAALLFCEYMHRHRKTADGGLRDPDNWQKGIPRQSYMESLQRHILDLQLWHDGYGWQAREGVGSALAGIFFNAQGYMHELMKEHPDDWKELL